MTTSTIKILRTAAMTGVLLGGTACHSVRNGRGDERGGKASIVISKEPESKLAEVGTPVEFTPALVPSGASFKFQWFLNSKPIDETTAKELGVRGATSQRLRIPSVAATNVGFYECAIEVSSHGKSELLFTKPAELLVYHHSTITVYGTPIGGGGTAGPSNCPPRYLGYVNFRKPTYPYGWRLTRPSDGGKACDPNREDAVVRYFGSTLSNTRCGTKCVEIPKNSQTYRFTIYFPSNPPSGPYSIQLDGFNP